MFQEIAELILSFASSKTRTIAGMVSKQFREISRVISQQSSTVPEYYELDYISFKNIHKIIMSCDYYLIVYLNNPVLLNLCNACISGDMDIIKLMIKNGANNYNSALCSAAHSNKCDIIRFLVEKGADEFEMALTYAVENNSVEAIKLLVSLGAVIGGYDINIALNTNNNILDLLIGLGYTNYHHISRKACVSNNKKAIQILVNLGVEHCGTCSILLKNHL
jgi:hypothetical protein